MAFAREAGLLQPERRRVSAAALERSQREWRLELDGGHGEPVVRANGVRRRAHERHYPGDLPRFGHTQFSLASTVYAAETVHIQGTDDLYGEEQARILASHEYIARLENLYPHAGAGQTVAVEPWLCGGSLKVSVLPTWEVAYNHYNGRKHIAMPQTAETITFMRANVGGYTNLQLAWETLTHAFQ